MSKHSKYSTCIVAHFISLTLTVTCARWILHEYQNGDQVVESVCLFLSLKWGQFYFRSSSGTYGCDVTKPESAFHFTLGQGQKQSRAEQVSKANKTRMEHPSKMREPYKEILLKVVIRFKYIEKISFYMQISNPGMSLTVPNLNSQPLYLLSNFFLGTFGWAYNIIKGLPILLIKCQPLYILFLPNM